MIKKSLLSFSLLLLCVSLFAQQTKYTLSGYVREEGSAELLIGVNVFFPQIKTGTVTNNYGFYSITLPKGKYAVLYSFVGYENIVDTIELNGSTKKDVHLKGSIDLKGVEVKADAYQKISQDVQMSSIEIPITQIKSIPAFMGEKDVFKALQLMPGVQKGNEGSSGIYVRGGGPDQNLIILDDAVVYNANHLFGFFSLFNGDALKSVELIKGGFPARYGGRLSSVVEMNMKDGNKKEYHGEAGIGLIASRITVEGPIKKDTSSFLFSARRTYIDALARPFMKIEDGVVGYYFYDMNAKVNYDFGRKNKLYLSGYFGRDKFSTKYKNPDNKNDYSKMGLFWQNATGTARWNHLFNEKLFSNTSFIFSNYTMSIYSYEEYDGSSFSLKYASGVRDFTLKSDFGYYPAPGHNVRFGAMCTYHRFRPSAVTIKDADLNQFSSKMNDINVMESGLYIEDEMKIGEKFRLNPGIRGSLFLHKDKVYMNPEPRLATSYIINEENSIKASYAMMSQYIHLLSNTGIGLPTDLWVPATNNVPPQHSQQVALGFAHDFVKRNLSLSVEGYYKKMKGILGYLDGANFMMISDPTTSEEVSWEKNVASGQGWSYGSEVLLQRKTGKLSGWIGYTLSWSQQQFDQINLGKKFWARYDRRHDISVVGIYKFNSQVTLSAVWVFSSGNAFTLPLAQYASNPHEPENSSNYYGYVTDYGERNGYRMRSYHRLDLSIQMHKKVKWGERTWELGVYNAYNRANPFFYFSETESNSAGQTKTVLKQVSLFPIIPSFSYTLKF